MSQLQIPVNSEYKFDLEPMEQAEYVNPVILNNKLIQNANAFILVSQKQYNLIKMLVQAKQEYREAEASRKDFEKALINSGKPNSNDRKTILLLEAFLVAEATSLDSLHEYVGLQKVEQVTKGAVENIQGKMSANEQIINAINASTLGIQTHLSYVKSEINHARNY